MTTDHEGDEVVFEQLRDEYQALVEELGDSLDIDSSPDPEGAVATEVAPDSDTARETER